MDASGPADGRRGAGAPAATPATASPASAAPRREPGGGEGSSLSASLMQDLMRFEHGGEPQTELLGVLAACVRHTQALAIRLAYGEHELTLTVFPLEGQVHCPMPIDEFLSGSLDQVQVLHVQPASLRATGSAEAARVGNPAFYSPLAPLLWAVALFGSRSELLPELAGQAAYRVSPGFALNRLFAPAAVESCIARLRGRSCNLREIAEWNGIGRERAARLMNALYLQSGLIVSRSHPAATNEGWAGYR